MHHTLVPLVAVQELGRVSAKVTRVPSELDLSLASELDLANAPLVHHTADSVYASDDAAAAVAAVTAAAAAAAAAAAGAVHHGLASDDDDAKSPLAAPHGNSQPCLGAPPPLDANTAPHRHAQAHAAAAAAAVDDAQCQIFELQLLPTRLVAASCDPFSAQPVGGTQASGAGGGAAPAGWALEDSTPQKVIAHRMYRGRAGLDTYGMYRGCAGLACVAAQASRAGVWHASYSCARYSICYFCLE
jgi:hypothetical protein